MKTKDQSALEKAYEQIVESKKEKPVEPKKSSK
jgi:hypothetical protein